MAIYQVAPAHRRKAERMQACSEALRFNADVDAETGEVKYRLASALCSAECDIAPFANGGKG